MKTATRIKVTVAQWRLASEGFTLLEVVVSLAILSLSLGVLYHVMASALGNESYAEMTNRARLMAQGLVARVGTDIPAIAGEMTGDDGHGMRWRLSRTAFKGAVDGGRPTLAAIEVSAEVLWGKEGSERSVRLTTLRPVEGKRAR